MSPMCSPEIDSRCERFDARSASVAGWPMPERSPVVSAAATPPASPSIVAIRWTEIASRRRLTRAARGAGGAIVSGGARV